MILFSQHFLIGRSICFGFIQEDAIGLSRAMRYSTVLGEHVDNVFHVVVVVAVGRCPHTALQQTVPHVSRGAAETNGWHSLSPSTDVGQDAPAGGSPQSDGLDCGVPAETKRDFLPGDCEDWRRSSLGRYNFLQKKTSGMTVGGKDYSELIASITSIIQRYVHECLQINSRCFA